MASIVWDSSLRNVVLMALTVALQGLCGCTELGDNTSAAAPAKATIQVPVSRQVAIAITATPVSQPNDFWPAYGRALDLAVETGMHLPGEISLEWSQVEHRDLFGQISHADPMAERALALMRARKLPVVLTLSPFETMNSRIPADLAGLPLDHPQVLQRLRSFVDWAHELSAGLQVVRVVFGNEFDVHMAAATVSQPDRWRQLEGMVVTMRDQVRSLPRWRDVPFALQATYGGLMQHAREPLQRLNRHADVLGVSYYPLVAGRVQPPSVLAMHWQKLLQLYPDLPVDFYQYGYPSSEAIGSSLELQRQFIAESFRLWDVHRQRVRILTFTWLHDVPSPRVATMTTETIAADVDPGQALAHFLGSLGLLGTTSDQEKPAFAELKRQIAMRQW